MNSPDSGEKSDEIQNQSTLDEGLSNLDNFIDEIIKVFFKFFFCIFN